MPEQIEIAFRDVPESLGVFKHAFIIYTDSNGDRWLFSGFPEGGGSNNLGVTADFDSGYSFDSDYVNNSTRHVLETGDDLSDRWDRRRTSILPTSITN